METNEHLVSIIIPIYNTNLYLPVCVNSVLRQTYSRLDIILVNDGSTDASGATCDRLAELDSRVRVIHKSNEGLSEARNSGVAFAHGDLITFIDSDDWVEPSYVETLCRIFDENKADIAVCRMRRIGKDKEYLGTRTKRMQEKLLGTEMALCAMLYQKEFDVSACGKLYRMELLKRHPFPKDLLFEDLATTYKFFFDAQRVATSTAELYNYRQREGSITENKMSPMRLDELLAADSMYDFISANCPAAQAAALCKKMSCYFQVFLLLPKDEPYFKDSREKIWNFLRTYWKQVAFDSHARWKNRGAALLVLCGRNTLCQVWKIISKVI